MVKTIFELKFVKKNMLEKKSAGNVWLAIQPDESAM